MTTKFYQINGVWNTYQYWHDNYGYTTEPTQSMNFKSSASGTWGTDVNPGYFTSPGGDTIDNWSFWSEGIVGWKDIDQLALAGAYPATAIDILLERNGLIANAVYVDDSDELYYLIDGYLSDGWRSWDELEADGWQVYEGAPPYYIVVNETTGEVVYSISETEENPSMIFSQVGHIEMPDSDMIFCIELGVPVEEFWLGANGRSSTEDVNLQAGNKQYLRSEDGQIITDAGTITLYDQASALAYIKADGNTYEAAPGDYAFENERYPGSGEDLSLYTVDTGSTRSAWAALLEKVFPDILTLWAKITDNSEKMYLQTRVINTSTPNSTYLYALYTDEALTQRFVIDSNKTYELGVFKGQNFAPYDIQDVSQMPSTTVSGSGAVSGFLLVDQSGAYLWAATNNTYSTYVNAPGNTIPFKCRVSEPPAPSELTAYFTNAGSAGTGNTSMSSSQSYQLYDASGNALSFDLTKKYTINKYYNISGTEKSVGAYAKCIDVMGNLYLRPNASPTIFRAELSLSPQTTIEAYFTANGSSETTNTYCGNTVTKTLYDASGIPIPYDSTKTYTTVASFVVNGDTAYTDFTGNFAAWSDTVLKGRGTSNDYYKLVIRVE